MTCKLVNGLFFLQARVNGQGFNNIYMPKSTIIQITFEICYMYMSVIHSLIDIWCIVISDVCLNDQYEIP